MPFSMSDILAAYGGSPDPENPIPVDAPGAGVTPAGVLQAFGHVLAPGLVGSPFTDRIGPQGSAFTPAPTARDYATQLSRGKTNIDPLETMLGVAGGSPAMFLPPGRVPGGSAAVARFNKMMEGGATADEARRATGVNLGADLKPQMEISDAGSTFRMPTPEEQSFGGTLGDFMQNWRAGELVPELNRVPVVFHDPSFVPQKGIAPKGFFDLATNPPTLGLNPAQLKTAEDMRDAVLHEAQHGVQRIAGWASGGSPYDPGVKKLASAAVQPRKKAYEETLSDVSQRAGNWAMERAGDPSKVSGWIERYFELNPGEAQLMKDALVERAKFNRGRMMLEEQFKTYEGIAGEEQARVVQKSKDKTQEELLAGLSPELRSDRPYKDQLIIPQKARSWSAELPSFSERMGQARDVAFAGRQRGTGNILPRSTANEAPLLAPGETRGDLVGALTPGMAPAQESIADVGRRSFRERLGLEAPGDRNLQMSMELPPANENLPLSERLGPPLSRSERDWRNYGSRMAPDDVMKSEVVWGRAAMAREAGKDPNVAFAEAANDLYQRMGANKYVTPEMARRYMAVEQGRMRGIEGLQLSAELPPEMGDVAGPSMGVGVPSPYVRNPNAPLFDYARLGERVPTPQFNLTRTESTNVQPEYLRAGRAANIARVNKIVEQGIKEGGLDWHNMLPLLERYQEELGTQPGRGAFNTYMDRVGATSPNSNVMQNFRTASYYDYLLRNGLPLPELLTSPKGNPFIAPGQIPYPYGNKAQGLHVMNLQGLESGEGYPLSRPKPPSFAENMKGNYLPVAIDRHNLKLWGVNRPEGANLTGYRFLEDLQQQQAARMGIDPAQYQAAGWLPYADSGAVPALQLFEQRIARTADMAGLTKDQVLKEFIRGKMRLQ